MKTCSVFHVISISIFMVFFLPASPTRAASPAIGPNAVGSLVNRLSGKCVQPVIGDGRPNGNLVEITDCNSSFDIQYWEWTSDYQLYNPAFGKCLDTIGEPGTANGTKLQMYDCQNTSANPAQAWHLDNSGYFRNQHSGRCLDVPGAKGTASGSVLQIWDCELGSSSTDQLWSFKSQGSSSTSFGANQGGFAGYGEYSASNSGSSDGSGSSGSSGSATVISEGNIVSMLSGKCLSPVGISGSNGSRIQITECDALASKFWRLTSDGFLLNVTNNKCLDVAGAPGYKNGAFLQLWDCEYSSSTTDQKWHLTSTGYLQNNSSNRCVDVLGSSNSTSGAMLQLWDCELNNSTSTDQRWIFTSAVTAQNPYIGDSTSSIKNDTDEDQINQDEENWVANTFTPQYIFETSEPAKHIGFAYQVHPMVLSDGINLEGVVLTILALYEEDWAYPRIIELLGESTPAFSYHWHWGDNEALEIWLTRFMGPCGVNPPDWSEQYNDPNGTARCYTMKRLILHSHSHTRLYEIPAPPGVMPITFDAYSGDNVSIPGNRHAWVYISRGKHGAYINDFWECGKAHYQGNISWNGWIGLLNMTEICSRQYDSANAGWAFIPLFYPSQNVGEENHQLFTWMDDHPILNAFANENIWGTEPFCGGNPVPDQFLSQQCAGTNFKKWCSSDPGESCCGHDPNYIRFGQE
jgi:hypothetical protein